MGHRIIMLRRRLTRVFIKAAFWVDPDPPMKFTTSRYVDTDTANWTTGTTLRDVKVYGPGGDQIWPTR